MGARRIGDGNCATTPCPICGWAYAYVTTDEAWAAEMFAKHVEECRKGKAMTEKRTPIVGDKVKVTIEGNVVGTSFDVAVVDYQGSELWISRDHVEVIEPEYKRGIYGSSATGGARYYWTGKILWHLPGFYASDVPDERPRECLADLVFLSETT